MLSTGYLTLTHKSEIARDTLKLQFSIKRTNTIPPSDTPVQNPSTLPFLPGQFVSMKFGEKSWRAYSIASTPDEENLELVVRLVENGVASTVFDKSNIGDSFEFKGGFGHFILSETPDTTLVFCATGTGIAPFRGMIQQESAKTNPRPMILLYGGRDPEDLAYLDEIHSWSNNLETHLCFSQVKDLSTNNKSKQSPNTTIHQGRITNILASQSLDLSPTPEFYLCGNGDMVKSVQEILEEQSIPKEQIFMERFN